MSLRERTHYDGCEFVHLECAEIVIQELRQALAALENETGLHEERRQFNQRIAELERENAELKEKLQAVPDLARATGGKKMTTLKDIDTSGKEWEQQYLTCNWLAEREGYGLNRFAPISRDAMAHIEYLEAQLTASQQRYTMLQDETALCCEARKDAERQAVEMARLVQQFVRFRTPEWYLCNDPDYQAAKAVIDQYAKEPTGGEG